MMARAYILLLLVVIFTNLSQAQEVPLERCDRLHVIPVKVGDRAFRFLVDTGATSMLDLHSFSNGRSKDVEVTSWTGTLATSAREVTLSDVAIGETHLRELKLPAIDLSAIGNACGKRIDGILGADLLERLGATLDLKREMAHFASADDARNEKLIDEMHHDMTKCVAAFNDSNEKEFQDCIDPKIVLFSADRELYGREQTLAYFRETYFHQNPPTHFVIHQTNYHPIGDAVWYEYEFTMTSARGSISGRGMAMCRKSEGKWRMASMHHSVVEQTMTGSAAPPHVH
jgi:ketosteroid isomerase-like protein/predicted aspartyl protease